MEQAGDGTPAADLRNVTWRKSRYSNAQGTCVELARMPDGAVALRGSRLASPPLVFSSAEIDAFIRGAKDGQFDDLLG